MTHKRKIVEHAKWIVFFSGPNIYISYVRLGSLGKPTLTESSSGMVDFL